MCQAASTNTHEQSAVLEQDLTEHSVLSRVPPEDLDHLGHHVQHGRVGACCEPVRQGLPQGAQQGRCSCPCRLQGVAGHPPQLHTCRGVSARQG